MADFVWMTGQTLCIGGLAYGWFLALTYCEQATDARARADKAALLHHLAMA